MNAFINKYNFPVSGLIHLTCAGLSIAGTVLLIVGACQPVHVMQIVTFSIFGAGLIAMFSSSAVYHLVPASEKILKRLRKLDHAMIYVFIAASYTPLCLVVLKGGWGWSLFGVAWGCAMLGLTFKLFWFKAPRFLSTLMYVLMGWLAVIGIVPLIRALSTEAFMWLLGGGIMYTVGAVIYVLKKPNFSRKFFGFHEIWHIFVGLGAFAHFIFMYNYVMFF